MRESYVKHYPEIGIIGLCRYANQRDVVFANLNNENPTYDAYEQDIAVAYFYFDSATAFQFEKGVFSKLYGTFMNDTKL